MYRREELFANVHSLCAWAIRISVPSAEYTFPIACQKIPLINVTQQTLRMEQIHRRDGCYTTLSDCPLSHWTWDNRLLIISDTTITARSVRGVALSCFDGLLFNRGSPVAQHPAFVSWHERVLMTNTESPNKRPNSIYDFVIQWYVRHNYSFLLLLFYSQVSVDVA